MNNANVIIERLGALFVESLHIEVPSPDTDLFETGILDSLQLVELLLQLERCFSFRIAVEDIDLDNLRTLARIAQLVAANATAGGPSAQSFSSAAEQSATDVKGSASEYQVRSTERRAEGVKESSDGSGSGMLTAPALGGS